MVPGAHGECSAEPVAHEDGAERADCERDQDAGGAEAAQDDEVAQLDMAEELSQEAGEDEDREDGENEADSPDEAEADTGEDDASEDAAPQESDRSGEDDAAEVVSLLAAEDVDLLEISGGTYESPEMFGLADMSGVQESRVEQAEEGTRAFKEAYFAGFARRARTVAGDMPLLLTGGLRTREAMESLVESGAVDAVGLGRPLAVDPELPTKLLDGAADGIELPSYSPPPLITAAGESEWYEAQIGRMGDGEDVDPSLNHVLAAGRYVVGEIVRGLTEGPRRRRLARTA